MRGINPLEIPGYRLYNLAMHYIKDGLDENQLEALEMDLTRADNLPKPFQSNLYYRMQRGRVVQPTTAAPRSNEPIIPAKPFESRPDYVPKWWQGDSQNYIIARKMMVAAPKAGGQDVRN